MPDSTRDTIRAMHVINSYVLNATQQNFWVDGDDSSMHGNRSYSNDNRDHDWDTDYMFVAYFGRDMVWRRLYLETMSDILPRAKRKIILD